MSWLSADRDLFEAERPAVTIANTTPRSHLIVPACLQARQVPLVLLQTFGFFLYQMLPMVEQQGVNVACADRVHGIEAVFRFVTDDIRLPWEMPFSFDESVSAAMLQRHHGDGWRPSYKPDSSPISSFTRRDSQSPYLDWTVPLVFPMIPLDNVSSPLKVFRPAAIVSFATPQVQMPSLADAALLWRIRGLQASDGPYPLIHASTASHSVTSFNTFLDARLHRAGGFIDSMAARPTWLHCTVRRKQGLVGEAARNCQLLFAFSIVSMGLILGTLLLRLRRLAGMAELQTMTGSQDITRADKRRMEALRARIRSGCRGTTCQLLSTQGITVAALLVQALGTVSGAISPCNNNSWLTASVLAVLGSFVPALASDGLLRLGSLRENLGMRTEAAVLAAASVGAVAVSVIARNFVFEHAFAIAVVRLGVFCLALFASVGVPAHLAGYYRWHAFVGQRCSRLRAGYRQLRGDGSRSSDEGDGSRMNADRSNCGGGSSSGHPEASSMSDTNGTHAAASQRPPTGCARGVDVVCTHVVTVLDNSASPLLVCCICAFLARRRALKACRRERGTDSHWLPQSWLGRRQTSSPGVAHSFRPSDAIRATELGLAGASTPPLHGVALSSPLGRAGIVEPGASVAAVLRHRRARMLLLDVSTNNGVALRRRLCFMLLCTHVFH